MRDRPLYVPGAKPPEGSPIWMTFVLAGAAFCFQILCLGGFWWALRHFHVSAPLAAAAVSAAFLAGLAAWYWISVRRLTGAWRGAWSLPDTASVTADVDPPDALRRVLSLAKGTFVWQPWSSGDTTLTLTRKDLPDEASVQVVAHPIDAGTQLDFRVGSGNHVDNLIGRAMIARLLTEISTKTEWTRR